MSLFNKDDKADVVKKKTRSSRSSSGKKDKATVAKPVKQEIGLLEDVLPADQDELNTAPPIQRPPDDMATRPLPNIPQLEKLEQTLTMSDVDTSGEGTAATPRRLICQQLEVAYASDVGMLRDNNEDSLTVFMGVIPRSENMSEKIFGFFAVADGMGGHENGEVASNMAIRSTQAGVIDKFYLRSIKGLAPGRTGQLPGEILLELIEEANQAIVRRCMEHRRSMGTTLTCLVMVGNMGYVGHIGDSRLYGMLKENQELKQLTTDHSLVQRLVEAGALTIQEAHDSPQRSVLYRSLGQRLEQPADTDFFSINDFSHLLLCSDGLWDMLPDKSIAYIINKYNEPATVCRELINAANSAGGEDNVSVVVIKL
jgi:serine/threonine protein phosphatase PrpC